MSITPRSAGWQPAVSPTGSWLDARISQDLQISNPRHLPRGVKTGDSRQRKRGRILHGAATLPVCVVTSAFTLIELMAVITVIAILAALLLPALGAAKRKAEAARCAGNLHQLGIALNLYLQEHHFYPLATSGSGLGSWQGALRVYAGEKIFYCPQKQRAAEQWLELFPDDTEINAHYGYNFIGAARRHQLKSNPGLGGDFILDTSGGHYSPASETHVVMPSQMIALGDSAAFIKPPAYAKSEMTRTNLLYIAFPFTFPAWGYAGVGNWHDGGANLLFCDGHVEYAKQSVWLAATPVRRRLWNGDHHANQKSW